MPEARYIVIREPVRYAAGVALQERLVAARMAGAIPDTILLLEHRPVVTLGSRGRTDALLLSPAELAARGVDLVHATRGGDVTYHGPGQLVVYPILQLGTHEADSHGYLCNLETVALRTAAEFGVTAYRRKGKTGAWTDAGKLAAIGIRLRRWVSYHGMSVNVTVDLAGFQTIVPCGLAGEAVTSFQALLGARGPTLDAVRDSVVAHFAAVCGRRVAERRTVAQASDLA